MTRHNQNGELSRYAFFFITLRTAGRRKFFSEWPALRTMTENTWTNILHDYPQADSDNFSVEANCLYALIRIPKATEEAPEAHLSHLIALFRAASDQEWDEFRLRNLITQPQSLWAESSEDRPVLSPEALESFREFIVQKLIDAEFSTPEQEGYFDPREAIDWDDEENQDIDPEEWQDW